MTGYGRAIAENGGYAITFEIRTVNHRYLECGIRVPHGYGFLEAKLKEKISERVHRGKVEASLTFRRLNATETVQVNHDIVSAYVGAMLQESKKLAQEYPGGAAESSYLQPDLGLSTLLHIPEAFCVVTEEVDEAGIVSLVMPVVEKAIDRLCDMREAEGEKLRADVTEHLKAIETMRQKIEVLVPESVRLYQEKLRGKIEEVLSDKAVDEARIVTEVAIFADKVAVDEELVRLKSHTTQFQELCRESIPVGRKMDFLVQEMNREVNTTSAKSQSLEISKQIVEMKSEIEKIREQIQNIE